MYYNTIFFDLDDTLWDTAANSRESLEEIYHIFSFDNYYESFADFWNVYFPHNINLWNLFEENKITKHELMDKRFYTPFRHIESLTPEKSMEINKEFMSRTASKSRIVEGAKEILDWAKPKFKLCILSNGFEEVQYKKITNAGLDGYFDKIILSDHIGKTKPDRALFDYALAEMNAKAEETAMVGDNWTSDIIGAKNSNIDQVWYNPDKQEAKEFDPTFNISKLGELKSILQNK